MYKLSEKAAAFAPYQPLKGDYTVRLDANESYMDLSEHIKEEIAIRIKEIKFNRYPDPLAENVCLAFSDYYGIDKDYITAGNGSDELISVIVNGFFNRGGKVVLTSPDFSMYSIYCKIAEINTVNLIKNDIYEISADDIINAATENNVQGIIFSNPCNPTSKVMTSSEVSRIIKSLPDKLIVLDEAYMDFYGEGLIKEAAGYDNLIVLKTCSKAFGLAAIRLGFAVCCKTLTNALRAFKSPYNVNSLSALAGEVVLRKKEYLSDCAKKIILQKNKLYKMLCGVKGISVFESASNFVVVKTEKADNIQKSLADKGIAIRRLGDCLRINAGSDTEQEIFFKAFKEAL